MAEQVGQPSTETDTLGLTWVKSSVSSSGSAQDCVEVAMTSDGVLLRDSKDPGTQISVTRATWHAFLERHS